MFESKELLEKMVLLKTFFKERDFPGDLSTLTGVQIP
jgi:hypothetical protein